LETYQWDISDLNSITSETSELIKKYPYVDTVILMAGVQHNLSFFDANTSTDANIIAETNTNITAPVIISRTIVPFLATKAGEGKPANLLLVTSGLAFLPLFGFFPIYCSTKAALHTFAVMLRQQMNNAPELVKKNFSVCEVSPPYVDTALDAEHRNEILSSLGDHAPKPMAIKEYVDVAFEGLARTGEDGKLLREVTTPGFSELGAKTWRESFGKILQGMGCEC
jgi:short-subunit dehydrogenase involved in D-alanine esterification of teichoic acids